jgi:hypothetical protein
MSSSATGLVLVVIRYRPNHNDTTLLRQGGGEASGYASNKELAVELDIAQIQPWPLPKCHDGYNPTNVTKVS